MPRPEQQSVFAQTDQESGRASPPAVLQVATPKDQRQRQVLHPLVPEKSCPWQHPPSRDDPSEGAAKRLLRSSVSRATRGSHRRRPACALPEPDRAFLPHDQTGSRRMSLSLQSSSRRDATELAQVQFFPTRWRSRLQEFSLGLHHAGFGSVSFASSCRQAACP